MPDTEDLYSKTARFDPSFMETYKLGRNSKKLHIIRTSRPIAVTSDSTASVGGTVTFAADEHLAVYGDVVQVIGPIKLPGLDVTIACRQLEFLSDAKFQNPVIDVSGEVGHSVDTNRKVLPAAAGRNGGSEGYSSHAGENGHDGSSGDDYLDEGRKIPLDKAGPGSDAGNITIACDTLIIKAAVTLSANGGNGGNGGRGQDGGKGGDGQDGWGYDVKGTGGWGGNGGNGGDGGKGGDGGLIKFFCVELQNASKHSLTLSASAGSGGKGGDAGYGGNGGKGAKAQRGHVEHGERHLANGAKGGDGGSPGVPGYGGGCGKPKTDLPQGGPFVLRCPPEMIPDPGTRYSPQQPRPTLRLICEPGKIGENGVRPNNPSQPADSPGPWGAGGLGGDRADDILYPGAIGNPVGERGAQGGKRAELTRTRPAVPAPVERLWTDWYNTAPTPPRDRVDWPVWHHRTSYIKANCWNMATAHDPGGDDVASIVDPEQLQMLFDLARTRFLLAPTGKALDVPDLLLQLKWIYNMADGKLNPENKPADMCSLRESASATQNRLTNRDFDYFGHRDNFVFMGTLDKYKADLDRMLTHFSAVQDAYQQKVTLKNLAEKKRAAWGEVTAAAKSAVVAIELMEKDIQEALDDALAAIKEKTAEQDKLAENLKNDCKSFIEDVQGRVGLGKQDFWTLFNQLSFTNRDIVQPAHKDEAGNILPEKLLLGGAAAAGAMVFGQLGEMATKAMNNVLTDSGEPLNKQYVIRNVSWLDASIETMAGLEQKRNGFISQDPKAEYRLLVTRDQLNKIVEQFYKTIPKARDVSKTLDAYISAVEARNLKVDEWNQLLGQKAYLRSEKAKADAQSKIPDDNAPGLPAMARIAAGLNRHALDDIIYTLYKAGRVYTLHSLQKCDLFAELPANDSGEISNATLCTAFISFINKTSSLTDVAKSGRSRMQPSGVQYTVTLTDDIIALLKDKQSTTFKLRPPAPNDTPANNPFAGAADIRLTHIRPMAKYLFTTNNRYSIELIHKGKESFLTADGDVVKLDHSPYLQTFTYEGNGKHIDDGKLDDNYSSMMGPFCLEGWEISIPDESNAWEHPERSRDQLESITIEFEGEKRTFTAAARAKGAGK
jgi:hypothetical protein